MTIRATRVPSNQLTIGMFVASIAGRDIESFPAGGMLIETQDQLDALQGMCVLAKVDLSRSSERVYQIWSSNDTSLKIVEAEQKNGVAQIVNESQVTFHQPHFHKYQDEYGYQGRFVYRVLEKIVDRLIENDSVDIERLEKAILDFITYTEINPDLLHLESHLTKNPHKITSIALRAIIHMAIYAQSFNKNTSFVQPMALTVIVYAFLLNKIPKTLAQQGCFGDEADNEISSSLLNNHLKALITKNKFPLYVKKTIGYICERHNCNEPQQISNHKIGMSAQLINIAFSFELIQSNAFSNKPSSASEAITFLRSFNDRIFNPIYLEKMLQVMPLFPTGCLMQVGPKQLALVSQQHPFKKLNPKLLALTDIHGRRLEEPTWICNKVRLGQMRQDISSNVKTYEDSIRNILEIKMPWYKRLLVPTRIRSWLQKSEIVT